MHPYGKTEKNKTQQSQINMKTKLILFLLCFASLSVMGQGTISRQKKQTTTQKTKDTTAKTKPSIKLCDICEKPLSKCDYGGKHPYCQTCGKLNNKCMYGGEHPLCKDCGVVVDKCQYKGKHPTCIDCYEPIDRCKYKGKHPICNDCNKIIEKCQYSGKHPKCSICGLALPKCQYNGDHPKCKVCNKYVDQCNYKGNHPVCSFCHKLVEKCMYEGNHPTCSDCNVLVDKCVYKGLHPKCIDCKKVIEECDFKGKHPSLIVKFKNNILSIGNISYMMKYVNGGTYTIGATSELEWACTSEELPCHRVTVKGFYIGTYEVTQELWYTVMGSYPSHFKGEKKPVENISWNDCQTFISRLNSLTGLKFRLPTEAEWEFAARGGKNSKVYQYSGSNNLEYVGWYADNSNLSTHDVGLLGGNELGLFDMSGNVWEWCSDCYNENPQINPTGPTNGSLRVVRGGGWNYDAWFCVNATRNGADPDLRIKNLGFRLALSE